MVDVEDIDQRERGPGDELPRGPSSPHATLDIGGLMLGRQDTLVAFSPTCSAGTTLPPRQGKPVGRLSAAPLVTSPGYDNDIPRAPERGCMKTQRHGEEAGRDT
jgi:hypothetical protein